MIIEIDKQRSITKDLSETQSYLFSPLARDGAGKVFALVPQDPRSLARYYSSTKRPAHCPNNREKMVCGQVSGKKWGHAPVYLID